MLSNQKIVISEPKSTKPFSMKVFQFLAFSLFLFSLKLSAQTTIPQELKPLTAHDSIVLSRIPELELSETMLRRNLPSVVDNSALPYMRPLIAQVGLECGQASSIGIQFTYEINAKRLVPGNLPENQYATHFTYNFLNNGNDAGINYFETFEIIKYAGNPNVADYGGMSNGGASRWMNGYDKYYNAMKNRIENVFSIRTNTQDGLMKLKHWVYDHGNGSLHGGMASFYSQFTGPNNLLPPGTPEAGRYVITSWGSSPNHAMTIVGYNDSIRFDYNNDGQYTNHLDINGDGVVDVRDWEIGGFKMANTYGSISGWGNQGFAYMMYKTVADVHTQGGIWNNQVVVVDVKESHAPLLTAKTTITYPCRNKLKLMAGVATDPEATEPEFVIQFPMFDFQGGCNPMQGGSGGSTIEIGLDLNLLLQYVEPGETAKYFFMVVENDPSNSSQGMINSLELIDYTGDEPVSIGSLYNNVPIANNTTTLLDVLAAINYDPVSVLTDEIPPLDLYANNNIQLLAEGGSEPYVWYLLETYDTTNSVAPYPLLLGEQVAVSNNNDGTGAIDLPFEFPFYGKKYNRIYAAVDGFLMFEPSEVTWPYYVAGKSYLIQNKIIAPSLSKPFYINPSSGDGIWMQSGQGYVIVSWKLSVYGQSGNSEVSMAAKLHEDGKIEFFYGTHLAASFIAKFAGISAGDGINNVILNKTGTFIPVNSQHTIFDPLQAYNDITLTKNGLLQAEIYDYFPGQSLKVLVADNNNIRKTATLELQLEGLLMNYTVQSGGNEIIEFGETFSLDLNLQNINSFDLDAGSITLQSEDSYVSINNGQVEIPSLIAGESILLQDVFSVEVSTQVPNAHTAEFILSYESVSGSWSRPLMLKVYAPELSVMTTNINDGQNGILEPGETANLIVSLRNKGGARLNMLQAIISSEHPDLTIISSTTSVDFLHPQENWDAIFQIYLSETAEPMQVVDILLQIQAENNYQFSVNIPILTSLIVENFETGDFSLYNWEMAGENPWFITTTTPYEGAHSARSGAIGHNSFSTMALAYDVAYPDTMSFFYKVSSENNYDYLKFSVNGLQLAQWSGEKPWSRAAYLVQAGEQTFRWRYEKDFSVASGSDCAWVDYIVLPAKKIYTSTNETEENDIFRLDVSPNPTEGRIQIKVSTSQASTFTLIVTDLQGRILYKTEQNAMTNGSYTFSPDLNSMSMGSMLVILHSGKQSIVKKVIRTGR
jgi:hypothetical protein